MTYQFTKEKCSREQLWGLKKGMKTCFSFPFLVGQLERSERRQQPRRANELYAVKYNELYFSSKMAISGRQQL